MANIVQLKRSSVAGRIPDAANVEVGEPVINLNDKVLYTKNGSGSIIVIGAGTTTDVAEGTNKYFTDARVKTAIASQQLDNASFSGAIVAGGELSLGAIGGDEGGQINLGKPATNTSLAGNVAIDIYQNKLRIFEGGGSARGVYVDLTTAGAGVGTNLIGSGSGTITSVAGITSGAVSNAQLAAATVTSQTLSNATFSANVTADRFASLNNGNGENYQVGDDVWLGDTNLANTLRVKGIQDATQGYILFGSNDGVTLGRSGSGALTYTGAFTATGNVSTGNVSGTAGTFTFSRLGTVQSGTWQGTSISTTYTDAKVTSVAGAAGAISNTQLASGISSSGILTTANVSEVTNLYFTDARVYSNVTQLGYITSSSLSGYATNAQLSSYATNAQLASYATNSQLGLYATNAQLTLYSTNANLALKANIADLTTSNVTELTNLYFSNARVYSNVTQLGYITSSSLPEVNFSNTAPASPISGDVWINSDTGKEYLYYNDGTSSQWVEEGSSVYLFQQSLTTANITESTNLYYTDARAYSNVSVALSALDYASNAYITSQAYAGNTYVNSQLSTKASTGKAIAMAMVFGG